MNDMSLLKWVVCHILILLFLYWVAFRQGAYWLERIFFGRIFGIFINPLLSKWDSEQMKIYAFWVFLIDSIWFIIGVFIPGLRFFF